MRESNERSSDLQSKVQENERIKWEIAWCTVQSPSEIPEKNWKTINTPDQSVKRAFCYTKEITAAAIFDGRYLPPIFKQEDHNNHLIEEAHAFCGIENSSTASTLSSNNSILNSTIESTAFKETNLNIHLIE